jgi:hypothetical protein
MAYHVRDWGSIAGLGGPIFVAYTLGGNDRAQWAEAIPQSPDASLVSTDHTVQRTANTVTFYFWVRNEVNTPTSFTLSGGGAS